MLLKFSRPPPLWPPRRGVSPSVSVVPVKLYPHVQWDNVSPHSPAQPAQPSPAQPSSAQPVLYHHGTNHNNS